VAIEFWPHGNAKSASASTGNYRSISLLLRLIDSRRVAGSFYSEAGHVSHYRIAPQQSLSRPTIYRQKSAPNRQPPSRVGFLPVNCRPGKTFLGEASYNGEIFMAPAIF